MGRVRSELGAKVCLDTNIVIYAVEGFATLATQIQALLSAMDDAEISAVTSELTLAEVLIKPLRDQNQAGLDAYRQFLTSTTVFQSVPISKDILEEAARICATTKLKLPDAIHLATATLNNCDSFLTNDQVFKSITTANIKLLSEISLV